MMDYNVNAELARSAEKGDVDAIAALDARKQNQICLSVYVPKLIFIAHTSEQ